MSFGPIHIDNAGPVPVESFSRPLLGGRYGVAVIVPHRADVPAAERAAVGAEVAEALRQLADSFADWGATTSQCRRCGGTGAVDAWGNAGHKVACVVCEGPSVAERPPTCKDRADAAS